MKTEPNNLETQIKEQLNTREIQPSKLAWDRLDAMLSVTEEKKTTRSPFLSFRFIGIAASVLVIVSLGLFFFNQKETVIKSENSVVVKEVNNSKINNNDDSNINNNKNSLIVNQKEVEIKNQKSTISNQKSSKSFNQNNQKTSVNSIINQKQEAVAQKDLPIVTPQKEVISKPSIVNVDELLVSVKKTPESNVKSKVKVNANSLLSQVDGELNQSFRDRVITKISKNYKEVKVALATRNQE